MDNEKIKSWLKTPRGRKIFLASFSFVALMIVIFSVVSINKNVRKPFGGPRSGWQNYLREKNNQEIAKLKNNDTDGDGLSDFEEKAIYGTSMYVADTDSDGISDGDEVARGDDPLCASGSDCYATGILIDDADGARDDKGEIAAGMSAEQIRSILIQSGVSSDLLKDVDDETLIEIYQENIGDAGVSLPDDDSIASESDGRYSAATIRQFMSSMGLEDESLADVSDEEIVATYYNTVEQTGQDPIGQFISGDNMAEDFGIDDDLDELRQYLIENGMSESEVNSISDEELRELIKQSQQ